MHLMVVETKLNEEFHPNGKLAYTETIGILEPSTAHLYDNRRTHPDGYQWIRLERHAKYFDNGQLNWELNYDQQGNCINDKKPSYRKDGTVITY